MLDKLMTKIKEAQKEQELTQIDSDNALQALEKAQKLCWKTRDINNEKLEILNEAENKLLKFVKNN